MDTQHSNLFAFSRLANSRCHTSNPVTPKLADNRREVLKSILQHSVSLPTESIRTSRPCSTTQIRFQELPEFRLQHFNISTALEDDGDRQIESDFNSFSPRKRVVNPFEQEYAVSAATILSLLKLRDKYMFEHCQYSRINDLVEEKELTNEPEVCYLKEDKRLPKMENAFYRVENGIFIPYIDNEPISQIANMNEYMADLMRLILAVHNSANKSYCFKRLNILEERFKTHLLLNQEDEILEQKWNQQRDFYNVRKVDTHIHHTACMNVNQLIDFIKMKVKEEPNRPVIVDRKTGQTITLMEVFERHKLNPQAITVDVVDMQAGFETFHRFDRFNQKYNPFSRSEFKEIFLKADNLIGGEYLADITKQAFQNYGMSKYQFSELRISIHGKSPKEWDKLADWFDRFGLYHHHVRWLIQIPRIYEIHRQNGEIENFQQLIDNIFKPVFEVTINPDSNPKIYKLLLQIVGFDSVDDESLYEKSAHPVDLQILPSEWNSDENPHYCYWAYYLWANISALNHLRKARGLNSFAFRPHCGEAGSAEHLMAAFLLADGINHGIRLAKAPVLEYLFYLKQIGIAMSPLSNNKLFLKYANNPFPKFFARGLNVSLSTDDPLIFHMTNEPLMEEYSVASQIYGFSSCDNSEIARNSVLQSGFEDIVKKYWLGPNYASKGDDANCFELSNVANTRFQYRRETLKNEMKELEEKSKPLSP